MINQYIAEHYDANQFWHFIIFLTICDKIIFEWRDVFWMSVLYLGWPFTSFKPLMFYYFLWDEAKNNQQKAASDEILLRMNKLQ